MSYIEGFVIPVPEGNKGAYLDMARRAADVFKRHGAEKVVEAWEDDVPEGQHTDFRRAVAAEPGERIVFSWIAWPSRAARDAGNAAAMEELTAMMGGSAPFDGRRMIFGGFMPILEA